MQNFAKYKDLACRLIINKLTKSNMIRAAHPHQLLLEPGELSALHQGTWTDIANSGNMVYACTLRAFSNLE